RGRSGFCASRTGNSPKNRCRFTGTGLASPGDGGIMRALSTVLRWGFLVFAAGCGPAHGGEVEVVGTHSHHPADSPRCINFTQGLLFKDGLIYESTGLEGCSVIKRYAPAGPAA